MHQFRDSSGAAYGANIGGLQLNFYTSLFVYSCLKCSAEGSMDPIMTVSVVMTLTMTMTMLI